MITNETEITAHERTEAEEIPAMQDTDPTEALTDLEQQTGEETDTEIEDGDEDLSADIDALASQFPELTALNDISELNNAKRYAELRALGLTPAEAYLATAKRSAAKDSRSHLRSSVPGGVGIPHSGMSARQMNEARELFSGLSDAEIRSLYKKVTK